MTYFCVKLWSCSGIWRIDSELIQAACEMLRFIFSIGMFWVPSHGQVACETPPRHYLIDPAQQPWGQAALRSIPHQWMNGSREMLRSTEITQLLWAELGLEPRPFCLCSEEALTFLTHSFISFLLLSEHQPLLVTAPCTHLVGLSVLPLTGS